MLNTPAGTAAKAGAPPGLAPHSQLPFKAPPSRPQQPRPQHPSDGQLVSDGAAAPAPADATDLDTLLMQPPAKRAKAEEDSSDGYMDPALAQALADGSLPPLPKPLASIGGPKPPSFPPPGKQPAFAPLQQGGGMLLPGDGALSDAGLPVPKQMHLGCGSAPLKVSPPQRSAGGGPPMPDPSGGLLPTAKQPVAVPPPPKIVPYPTGGFPAPKMAAGVVQPPSGSRSKSGGQLVPPPTLSPAAQMANQGVTVPPPPTATQWEQQHEDSWQWQPDQYGWQQEEWCKPDEEQHRLWGEECKRQEEEQKERLRLYVEEQMRLEEEEKARLVREQREREEARKAELEEVALQLHGELSQLLATAEDRVEQCKVISDSIEGEHGKTFDEVIKIADDFEAVSMASRTAVKTVSDFMAGKYLKLQGSSENMKQEAANVLKRFKAAEREAESRASKVWTRKREALIARDKELKRQAALRAVEKQESLFKQYDVDQDGILSAHEVGAFVKGECNFDLPQEKVEGILQSEAFTGHPGVPKEKFTQLRLLVGVAAVVGALSGMEAEVAKAEEKAKPLSARGRQVMPLDVLAERTDDVDRAVDAARDYLAAAREQVQCLDVEQSLPTAVAPTAVRMAVQEARKLGTRLDWFEQRLARAAAASKASRDRLVLQQKKEELMRQAMDMAASSPLVPGAI
mmetsp:Transcript_102713/g.306827  ORF Transcript_102713/g.306827 Transcript_102713/m.306827 type:complete len:684 (+) Transcript_102713:95-2146(+)